MAEAGLILVDTSVWIRFFRFKDAAETVHADELLQARAICTCLPVRVEVLSGVRTEKERVRLKDLFLAIPCLLLPDDIWDQIEEARFKLARKGHQASLIDLMIACAAASHGSHLWTLDQDFEFIQEVVQCPRYKPVFGQ